jgi:hypothetical protein
VSLILISLYSNGKNVGVNGSFNSCPSWHRKTNNIIQETRKEKRDVKNYTSNEHLVVTKQQILSQALQPLTPRV